MVITRYICSCTFTEAYKSSCTSANKETNEPFPFAKPRTNSRANARTQRIPIHYFSHLRADIYGHTKTQLHSYAVIVSDYP